MSKNKKYSTNHSTGVVNEPTQVYNPSTGHYIYIDAGNGKYIVKKDGPHKGVNKEDSKVLANPNIDKKIARKAEKAVIEVMNKLSKKK